MDNSKFTTWMNQAKLDMVMAQEIGSVLSSQPFADELLAQAITGHWSPQMVVAALKANHVDVARLEAKLGGAQRSEAINAARARVMASQNQPISPVFAGPPIVEEPALEPTYDPLSESRIDPRRRRKPQGVAVQGEPKKSLLGGLMSKFSFGKKESKYASAQMGMHNAAPGKPGGNNTMMVIGVVVALLLVLGIGAYFIGSGNIPGSGNQSFGGSPSTSQSVTASEISKKAPELSPTLKKEWNEKDMVGVVLMLVLTGFAFGEGGVRKKGQSGAMFFSMVGVIAGWSTMPILVAISGMQTVGWQVVGLIVIAILWATAFSTIQSQNDLTPIIVALGLFTATLFYWGHMEVIPVIGALFGAKWTAWSGVTTFAGSLSYLMTHQSVKAYLTIFIFIFGGITIYLASKEVGKKHGSGSALIIGVAIIVVFILSQWGLTYGLTVLKATGLSKQAIFVFQLLVPILAWVISLLTSVGIGLAMGDVEVGRAENKQRAGIEKTGTFIQNIADFGILGTIVPLFLGVIMIFF